MTELNRALANAAALAQIGEEFLERADMASYIAFGERMSSLKRAFASQHLTAEGTAPEEANLILERLRAQMESCIGEAWDDPNILFEWSGYFLGAMMITWALISNITTDDGIRSYAIRQMSLCNEWLAYASRYIGTITVAKKVKTPTPSSLPLSVQLEEVSAQPS